MKKTLKTYLSAAAVLLFFVLSTATAQTQDTKDTLLYKYKAINTHSQIYAASCIPSSIEMVLKLNKKADASFYTYQQIWGNKLDGTFANFDGLLLNGIRFHHKFNFKRDDNFPLNDLFTAIDQELGAGRYVIVSLPSGFGWHMYFICSKLPNGEFAAYSKNGSENLIEINVKKVITGVKGTDIMVYREQ